MNETEHEIISFCATLQAKMLDRYRKNDTQRNSESKDVHEKILEIITHCLMNIVDNKTYKGRDDE